MNHSRRSFLRSSALGLGALAFASPALQALAAVKYKKLVGIQLYSVRDDMRKDPQATLEALAQMGYKYVEHANYIGRKFYGWEAKEFKKRLDDLGMKMPSGHRSLEIYGRRCSRHGARIGDFSVYRYGDSQG